MAYVKYKEHQVYYEEHGTSGNPLIILNGIMMSTLSWSMFVEEFSSNNRLILVDFLDQGQSSRLEGMQYHHDIQVEALRVVVEHLNLDHISLFGISYGGEIAMQYALKYPKELDKLLLFNTTSWTSPWLEEVGNAWNGATDSGENYYATTIPVIYSPSFYSDNVEWMNKRKELLIPIFSNRAFIDSMIRLTNSSIGFDCRNQLHKIEIPTLVVSSEYDFVTPKNEQEFMVAHIPNVSYAMIPNAGHASMYEQPNLFATLIFGFIFGTNRKYKV